MSGELMSCIPPRWNWGMLVPSRGYNRCYRCRRPMWLVEGYTVRLHPPGSVTEAGVVVGQYAACSRCWPRMSEGDRVEAHRWVTWVVQGGSNVELWDEIVAAVRRG